MNTTIEDYIRNNHTDWLNHPITKQMFENINKLRDAHIQQISINSVNEDPLALRINGLSIRQIDAIVKLTQDTNLFIAQAKK